MLKKSYDWIMNFAGHPKAGWMLNAVAFAESSFFPIPPDPLYIAMILASNRDAWHLAMMCTISSVVGGMLGYYIGYGLYETLGLWIMDTYGMHEAFAKFQDGFNQWGFWIIALKGLTPIPYKVVTIASGVAKIDLVTFISASIIARGFRFFSLAGLLKYFGPEIKDYIEKNLTFVVVAGFSALAIGFLVLKYL